MPTPSSLLASFSAPDDAKAAVAGLERSGVPSGDIRLLTASAAPGRDGATADREAMGWLGAQARRGAAIGGAVGLVLLLVVFAVTYGGDFYGAWIVAGLGGALGGALVGAMITVGWRAPRDPGAWDAYMADHAGETIVEVTLRGGTRAETVTEVVERAGATSVVDAP